MNRLTALAVKRATEPGRYPDGGGLFLQVSETGTQSWIYRYMLRGTLNEMGLGPVHAVGLADARAKAAVARSLKWSGVDPLKKKRDDRAAVRAQTQKSMSFKEAAEAYCAAHKAGWKNRKHADQWSNTLTTYAYPAFGDLPVQKINTGHVMQAVEPIWRDKTETASRVRGRIEAVLDWAKAHGHRDGENPARWRGHLENLLPERTKVRKVKHFSALPYTEVGAFMAGLRQQQGLAARALELLILTATRTGETIGARWTEFDLDQALWMLPAERTKTGKDHRIPLSDAAIALLRELQELKLSNQFVFPGERSGKPLSNMAMLKVLERMKRDDITVHGFRSTFRDWCAESGYSRELAEMALAHVVDNKVEAAYFRSDLFMNRKALMTDWARYCGQQAVPTRVIQLADRSSAA